MSKWKRKQIDVDIEKDILIGIITNDRFITEIQKMLVMENFKTPYAKKIVMWCNEYFKKYKKAPGKNIKSIFNSYIKNQNIDETQIELIEKFLSGLSDSYIKKNFNLQYALDKAELYFRTRQIELHRDNIVALLMRNEIDEAEKEIATFKRVTRPSTVGIDILNDNINKYLNEEYEKLFSLPGDLGKLVGTFHRGDFVAVAGPAKRGKTWWLILFAMESFFAELNILYFDLESTESKMLNRFYTHMSGQPKNKEIISLPYFDENNFIQQRKVKKEGLTGKIINKKREQLKQMVAKGSIRLMNAAQYSINVTDIKVILDNLEYYHNFIPDVIIIDYGDILSPEKYYEGKDERHRINRTWGSLRSLAQEKHCLVVTGTHTNKLTFKKDIEQGDLSEDIRKMAHITHGIALNQTTEDKKQSLMRIGVIALREEEFFVDEEVIVLQCLKIGQPYIDSRFKKKVKNLNEG
jgi:replicative DNA helicase